MSKGKGTLRENACMLFDQADCDGSGCLSRLELWKLFQELKFKMSADEVNDIFNSINPNGDDKLTKDEFLRSLDGIPREQVLDADLERVFNDLDTDGTGFLTRDEIMGAMSGAGYSCEDVLAKVDDNADGKVSLAEFIDMFRNQA